MTAWQIILLIIGALVLWQLLIRFFRKRVHFPVPAFIGRYLDSPVRRWMQPPDAVMERSGIQPGMTVMELGCGSGAFTLHAARVVGPAGKVYAIDIQPKMLEQLERKLERPENSDINNIELKKADAYSLPFDDGSLDLVYTVTVLQEIPNKSKALWEIKRVLKPGGILAVTEFFPDPDYPWSSTTARLGKAEGFTVDAALGNFWNYTVRFRKPVEITKHQKPITKK